MPTTNQENVMVPTLENHQIQNALEELSLLQKKLTNHPVYSYLKTPHHLKVFMSTHIYAVWDFMSLAKRIQNDLTCTTIPWYPSKYSKSIVRSINEIILGEESDRDPEGNFIDHFSLYVKAMEELSISTSELFERITSLNFIGLPSGIKNFVEFNLNLAQFGKTEEVVAAFFYGREKIIPAMFQEILQSLQENSIPTPSLTYYIERHIALDGDEHSHFAEQCLNEVIRGDQVKELRALNAAIESIKLRIQLWDSVCNQINLDQ